MIQAKINRTPLQRFAIACLGLITVLVISVSALSHPLHDFVEYWTAAHLLMEHKNPYSLGEVSEAEHALGFEEPMPIMLLSPPPTLAMLAPLGLIKSYALGWFLWLSALIIAVGLSSRMLMDVYFGDLRLRDISDTGFYRSLFAFTFFPVLLCLRFTQTAPLIFLGLASFVYFERKQRPWLAGAFLSLTLIKPHLTYLVWIALLFWCWQRRLWRVLASAAGVACLLTGIAVLVDRHIVGQYLELIRSPYMEAYAAGVASLLRKLTEGVGTLWIQLVPTGIGLIWFVIYWRRNCNDWSWVGNLPIVLTVSVFTSPYGWHFDQALLALPVIAVAGWRANALGALPMNLVISYTVLNGLLMLLWALPTLALLPAPIFLIVLLSRERRSHASAIAVTA